MQPDALSHRIKNLALKMGFSFCGFAKAEPLDEDARRLEAWLNKGMHGSMHYMENHFELRIDPSRLVPGAKSVITLLKNYYPSIKQGTNQPKVASYAYGEDYHVVIRKQLKQLLAQIKEIAGDIQGRGFVDSAPVLERTWAQKSGLGWVGKNGNLIHPKAGSYFFIATLITDLELLPDSPLPKDFCGTCTKCIDACPTEAILPNKVVDGSKCISYFTIELKELVLPNNDKPNWNDWLFGCDICQDVCPWNRFSQPHKEPAFTPLQEIMSFSLKDWEALTEDSFQKIFGKSAIKRSKLRGIQRNLQWIRSTS